MFSRASSKLTNSALVKLTASLFENGVSVRKKLAFDFHQHQEHRKTPTLLIAMQLSEETKVQHLYFVNY